MRRNLCAVLMLCVVVAMSVGCAVAPSKATSDITLSVISKSPNGIHAVLIEPPHPGELFCDFLVNPNMPDPHMRISLGKSNDWFMHWDEQDRLWVYVPESGSRMYYATGSSYGFTTAGEQGGWDGMPPEFLECLPQHQKDYRLQCLAKQAR